MCFALTCFSQPIDNNCFIDTNKKSKDIYHKGWIDSNKNGKNDIYEDASKPVEERLDDLISQMTVEEKTCQMATLYGYGNVLEDELPTEKWKNEIWKDGIGNIDEHLNSVYYKNSRSIHIRTVYMQKQ